MATRTTTSQWSTAFTFGMQYYMNVYKYIELIPTYVYYFSVENMRQVVICVAFMEMESNVILRPCNHTCLCGACFQSSDRLVCPLYREQLT